MAGLLGNMLRGAGQGAFNSLTGTPGVHGAINPQDPSATGQQPIQTGANSLLSQLLEKLRRRPVFGQGGTMLDSPPNPAEGDGEFSQQQTGVARV